MIPPLAPFIHPPAYGSQQLDTCWKYRIISEVPQHSTIWTRVVLIEDYNPCTNVYRPLREEPMMNVASCMLIVIAAIVAGLGVTAWCARS